MWRNIGLWALLSFVLFSCEDAVELDVGDLESKLVVVSNFVPDKPVEVFVSKTKSVLSSDDTYYLRNANVKLYRGNSLLEVLHFQLGTDDHPSRYVTSEYIPKVNETYTLRVDVPEFEPSQAKSIIPQAAPIRSLNIDDVVAQQISPDSLAFSYRVKIVFADPPNIHNYYHLKFYQQIWNYELQDSAVVITNSDLKNINFSSQNDNNSFIAYFDGGVLFEDVGFDGKLVSYSFILRTDIQLSKEILGKMFAELRTTSEDYFLYHNSLSRQQTSSGGPLAEPVIIYNNIENGRGIFAGYNLAVDSVAIR